MRRRGISAVSAEVAAAGLFAADRTKLFAARRSYWATGSSAGRRSVMAEDWCFAPAALRGEETASGPARHGDGAASVDASVLAAGLWEGCQPFPGRPRVSEVCFVG